MGFPVLIMRGGLIGVSSTYHVRGFEWGFNAFLIMLKSLNGISHVTEGSNEISRSQ